MGFSIGGSVGPFRASLPLGLARGTATAVINPIFPVVLALACGVGGVLTGHGFADGMFVGIVWFWGIVLGLMVLAWAVVIAAVVLFPVLLVVGFVGVVLWAFGQGIIEGIRTPVPDRVNEDEDQHKQEVIL